MPIKVPGKRYGKRLEKSKVFGHGGMHKKSGYADLLITPLVDMFVIIVLFLIANFSATGEILNQTKDISLPSAVNVQELKVVPVVMISNEQVIVDGALIGRVDDLTRDDLLNIEPLVERLRESKKKTEDLHSADKEGAGFDGDINIQAHKEVPFKIIKKVMFSCATAGFGNINFAVLQVGGAAKPETGGEGGPTGAQM